MYLVAVLFVLWGLANLAGGDYVDVVIGVAAASALAAGQYFWDELGGGTLAQRLKVPVIVGVMIAGLAVVAVLVLEEIEVSAARYVRLEAAVEEFPDLRPAARKALSDRKVSIVEFHDLEQAYHRLAKQRAIRTLNGR